MCACVCVGITHRTFYVQLCVCSCIIEMSSVLIPHMFFSISSRSASFLLEKGTKTKPEAGEASQQQEEPLISQVHF